MTQVVDNIIRTMAIISSKYAPAEAQMYNTIYLTKLGAMGDEKEEKINTVIAIARGGVHECCKALNVEYKKVMPIYIKSLRRMFSELLESI